MQSNISIAILILVYFALLVVVPAPVQYSMGGDYKTVYGISHLVLSILKIVTSFTPWLIIFMFIAYVSSKYLSKILDVHVKKPSDNTWRNGLIILCLLALVEFTAVNIFMLENIPHVPDSVSYIHQAKIFLQGKYFMAVDKYSSFFPLGLVIDGQKQFSQYTFGWPLILSLGYKLKVPWLITPLMGVFSLILLYCIAKELYSAQIGFISALLYYTSPFMKMNSIDYMSHGISAVFILFTVYMLTQYQKYQDGIYLVFTGLLLGYLVNIRPFTGFLIGIIVGITIMILNYVRYKKSKNYKSVLYFLIGFIPLLFLYAHYNYILNGNYFKSYYGQYFINNFGITSDRTINMALSDTYSNILLLDKVLLGWPTGIAFMFVFLYLLTPNKRRWEYFFITIILVIFTGYFFYKGSWMMYGPRFWYETTPFWILLIVLGIHRLPQLSIFINLNKARKNTIMTITTLLVMIMVIYNYHNWYRLGVPPRWHQNFTPQNIGEFKNFNYANVSLINNVKKQKISNAIILIKPGTHWWNYGVPSSQMSLTFQDDIIYAIDKGGWMNIELLEKYPNHKCYQANYDTGSIQPCIDNYSTM